MRLGVRTKVWLAFLIVAIPVGVLLAGPVDQGRSDGTNTWYFSNVVVDGGMGSFAAPTRTLEKQLCLDVANKSGVVVGTAPDAGTPHQNCFAVLPAVQKRLYATSNMCVRIGDLPASCSATAISTGLRVAADSPELLPFTATPSVMSNGAPPDAGQTATHLLLCALPTASAGVLEYTPYIECSATP